MTSSLSKKKILTRLAICTCLLAFIPALTLHISKLDPSAKNCILKVGISEWMPYQSISEKGVASGIQIDLLNQIAENANCQLLYHSSTFSNGLKAIESGHLNFIMNASISEERSRFAYFSQPYRNEFMLLYATKPYLSKCKTMSLVELLKDGFRLGVQENVVFGSIMRQIQADPELNSRLIYIENDSPHAELVKLKNLDGIIDDPVVVAYRSTINDTGKFLNACPITISSSPVRLMFSKKSVPESIVERFNQAIIQVKTSKEYKKHWDW